MRLLSEHSEVFFPCHERTFSLAPIQLAGAGERVLPGILGQQGDKNVFCELSDYASRGMERQILPMYGMTGKRCIVKELFINRQRTGAFTEPHVHIDDFYGAI